MPDGQRLEKAVAAAGKVRATYSELLWLVLDEIDRREAVACARERVGEAITDEAWVEHHGRWKALARLLARAGDRAAAVNAALG